MTSPTVTIVIPAHNEAARLGETLARVGEYFEGREGYDLVVVADRCTDDSVRIAKLARSPSGAALPLTIVRNDGKRGGKGLAIRMGIAEAKGDLVFFTDADLSTPIEEIDAFVPSLSAEYDVAIASRYIAGARIVLRSSLKRRIWSHLFRFIVKQMSGDRFSDTQCGFKGFRRDAGKRLAAMATIDGFAFDIELLRNAVRLGMKIVEIPVKWGAGPRSTVTLWNGPVRMLYDILRLKVAGRENAWSSQLLRTEKRGGRGSGS